MTRDFVFAPMRRAWKWMLAGPGVFLALLAILIVDSFKSTMRSFRQPLMRVGSVAIIAGVAMTVMCGWTGSCGTPLHKSAVAADAIASSLKTAADLNRSLFESGQITLGERQQIAELIVQTTQANDVLVAQLTAAEANGGATDPASLIAAFGQFTTQLSQLEADGVLHLKSPTAQAGFETILNAIKGSVATLQIQIGTGGSSTPAPTPKSPGMFILSALVLTPEEIALLISLATAAFGDGAALVEKLLAMKGEADTALLADATTQDAAARAEAQEDEAAQ